MTFRAVIDYSLRTPRGHLLLLLLIALAVRVAALYLGATALSLKGDEGYYLRQGQAILSVEGNARSIGATTIAWVLRV